MKKFSIAGFVIVLFVLACNAFATIPFESKPDTSKIKFTDVSEKHWARDIIYKLAGQKTKILGGYPDGTFKPDANITRAEFIAVLVRTLGLSINEETYSTYADVPKTHWASKYIGMAQQKGIIEANDYGDSLKPEQIITRFEACKMIINSFEKTKIVVNDNTITMYPLLKDAQKLDQKNKKVVHILHRKGILSGYADNTAGLEKYATRAELATFIMRFIENSDKLENYIVTPADLAEKKPFYNSVGEYTTYIELLPEYTQVVKGWPKRNPGLTEKINYIEFFHVDKNYNGKHKAYFDKVKKADFNFINTSDGNFIAMNVTIKYTSPINNFWTYDPIKSMNTAHIYDEKHNQIKIKAAYTEAYIKSIIEHTMDITYKFTNNNREKTYTIYAEIDKMPTHGKITMIGGRDQPNAADYRTLIVMY